MTEILFKAAQNTIQSIIHSVFLKYYTIHYQSSISQFSVSVLVYITIILCWIHFSLSADYYFDINVEKQDMLGNDTDNMTGKKELQECLDRSTGNHNIT